MKENKVWGETSFIWAGNNVEAHRIKAVIGGYCSKHKHEHKHNLFHVESGKLQIEIWREDGIIDKTILSAGESTSVPPCVYHRFTAIEDTVALEIYWVELYMDDIKRESQGGLSVIKS